MMRTIALVILALVIPACGPLGGGVGVGASGPIPNPDRITVSLQNNDPSAYNVSVWEFTGGVGTQILIAWPMAAAAAGSTSHYESAINFHADSVTVTHEIHLYSMAGALLDSVAFVKGTNPITLVVTITAGKMAVTVI